VASRYHPELVPTILRRGSISGLVALVAKLPRPFQLVAAVLALACITVLTVEALAFNHTTIDQFVWLSFSVLWNCAPILAALGLNFVTRTHGPGARFAGYGFASGSTSLALFGHLMWAFDIGKTATGSSTSALLFAFLPCYAFILGLILGAPAGLIGYLVTARRHQH
jgi:hypothetical protein